MRALVALLALSLLAVAVPVAEAGDPLCNVSDLTCDLYDRTVGRAKRICQQLLSHGCDILP